MASGIVNISVWFHIRLTIFLFISRYIHSLHALNCWHHMVVFLHYHHQPIKHRSCGASGSKVQPVGCSLASSLAADQSGPDLSTIPGFLETAVFQLPEFRVKIVIIGYLTFSCGSLDKSCGTELKYARIWDVEVGVLTYDFSKFRKLNCQYFRADRYGHDLLHH